MLWSCRVPHASTVVHSCIFVALPTPSGPAEQIRHAGHSNSRCGVLYNCPTVQACSSLSWPSSQLSSCHRLRQLTTFTISRAQNQVGSVESCSIAALLSAASHNLLGCRAHPNLSAVDSCVQLLCVTHTKHDTLAERCPERKHQRCGDAPASHMHKLTHAYMHRHRQ